MAGLAVAACSSGDDATGALQPAGSVRASETARNTVLIEVGKAGSFGDVDVTVTAFAVGGDDFGPWLTVTMHVENRAKEPLGIPRLEIHCTGSEEGGGYQMGSTLDVFKELPARTFEDGTLNLLMPDDPRTRTPVPACKTPAFARATGNLTSQNVGKVPQWRIPDDLVAQMNVKRLT